MNIDDMRYRLRTEPDFIGMKRFDYSLAKLLERYPEGCPDKIIAQALLVSEPEVEEMYQKAIARLRIIMGVTE
jgi:hypothetical protein